MNSENQIKPWQSQNWCGSNNSLRFSNAVVAEADQVSYPS